MSQERFSNLNVLDSHKKRTAKFAHRPKEVVTGPRTLKTVPRALETNDKTKLFNILPISTFWLQRDWHSDVIWRHIVEFIDKT